MKHGTLEAPARPHAAPGATPRALRLGYLIPEFPAQTHAFFWREVHALRASGVEVHLISTRRPPDGDCAHAFAADARRQTRYVFPPRLGPALAGALRAAPAAARHWARMDSGPAERLRTLALLPSACDVLTLSRELALDHIHGHSCGRAAHMLALCRDMGGPPYSLTLHGDLPVYGADHRAKMRRAAFVATVTRPLREQVIREVGLPAERTALIPMGVDTDRFTPGRRAWAEGGLRLISVARLNAAKGHEVALAALRTLLDRGVEARYDIVGDGPHRAAIEGAIARLGLAPCVRLHGARAEDEVLAMLRESDALLLCSTGLGEAAPVAVMEAMACGLVVVCSRIGGTPDMIDSGRDGFLCEQGSDQAVSDALLSIARDPARAGALRAAARERALRQFDYRVHARTLRERIEASMAAR